MSANPDSVVGQGEFHDRIPPAKPMTHKGHQIGRQVGNDAVPEFHAETYAPGTAPKEHSFRPNPESETPGQALNPDMDPSTRTGALDMPGATSKDVYDETTWGKPLQGQTQRELHGMHPGKRKKERSGLEGVGASTKDNTVEGHVREIGADLPEGIERGMKTRAQMAEGAYDAQNRIPASAEEVAAERR
ncbi:hypothetical protein QBC47DRAFT_124316 [Echria macrotheca]|uniref:Uncharacterized protein n=1 Tax=Echria macrotheca TaxID=438768 RepID=A0AAJ0F4G4_9PEZI|nr:hypothetical protein QBC47DRAFT_124316 [Echria macrotheca]